MVKKFSRPLLLRGKVVHPDGSVRDRYVLVKDGKIVSVSRVRPPLSKDAVSIRIASEEWIFPGLLDLHTHSAYNLLPIWDSPMAPFDNRYVWRSDKGYKNDVRGTYNKIKEKKYMKTLAVFGELQAIAGGTTVLQEAKDLDREFGKKHRLLLCRDTANPGDLLLDGKRKILSVVDFFRPDGTFRKPTEVDWSLKAYVDNQKEKKLLATLAHLAEGRSGFGHDRGPDPYSCLEFETFMAHPAFKDAGAVRETSLALIHCSGIDVKNPAHINFIRDRNISIIWSPVSNLLLYGDTLDVETLIANGINVALGSDWSPSGSKHVWAEAKFARFYFDAIGSTVSDEQIFQMVTTNASRCLGIPHLGRIEPGGLGDFLILRSPLESDNPLEVFMSTTDQHVRSVIVAGRPVYGDREFLEQFGVELQDLPKLEGSTVKEKAVHLPASLHVNVDKDITALENMLKELPKPVKRSNLLVSSDKIYRRRINELCQFTVGFGWAVQQWRKKGASPTSGALKVSPASVRVWRGFRAKGIDSGEFRKKLGNIFILSAVQTQQPLGLTAYLPAVLPDSKPDLVPDEVALVFYESKKTYGETFKTTAGRAYGLLHRPIFGSDSKSGFPKLLGDALEADQPYYLIKGNTDWYIGQTKLLVGTPKNRQDPPAFRQSLYGFLSKLQKHPPQGLDGLIAAASDQYVVYWEHWTSVELAVESKISELANLVHVVLLEDAEPLKVPADPFEPYDGIEINGGEFLNIRFQRRRLFKR